MKATEIIKGKIYFDTDQCSIVRIIDENGNTKRLTDFFYEFTLEYGNYAQVNYWVTKEPLSKDELIKNQLKHLYGAIDSDEESVYTGSWTYGPQSSYGEYEVRDSVVIGGHDLHDELSNADGEYLYMEVNFK